jgi:hypothetical protein
MTRYIKLSVSVPLEGNLLKKTNSLANKLKKKFNLSFIMNKNCKIHINLFSGITCYQDKIKEVLIKNKKTLKKNFIYTNGFGVFLNKYPTIYIRFKHNQNFTTIRNILFANIKLWKEIDDSVSCYEWIPKASIVHNDLNLSILSTVSKFILKENLYKKMLFNEILFTNFTKDETEIDCIKL